MKPLLPGFSRHELDPGWAALRDDVAPALFEAGVGQPERLPCDGSARGRLAHPIVDLGEQGRVVVRRCSHGGLVGKALGQRFWSPSRALNELAVSVAARARGAPAPEVVGVIVLPRAVGCRLFVLSRLIPDAVDLRVLLESAPLSAARRRRLAHAVAQAVAACHNAGLWHADLHVKNILVQSLNDPEPRAYVIDLDKATLHDALSPRQRLDNLARLHRSVEKWPAVRAAIGPRDKLRFLRAYERVSADLGRDAAQACARVSLWHKLFWRAQRPAALSK